MQTTTERTGTMAETKLPLEDGYSDILNKARKGLQLDVEEIVGRTQLPKETLAKIWQGEADLSSAIVRLAMAKLAFVLNLHPASLLDIAQGGWYPKQTPPIDGFAMFTTDYADMTVNAYLVWDPKTKEAATFDTGATCQPILDFIKENGLTLSRIFITHTHQDHLADLERLQAENPQAEAYGSAIENPLGLKPLSHGDGLLLGDLKIRVLGTHGHTPGGLSYFIEGLSSPLVMSGDAMFAGSQGGAPYAYQDALRNNKEFLLSLPEPTVLCPGHGPLSTIGEEKIHNPFFPEFK